MARLRFVRAEFKVCPKCSSDPPGMISGEGRFVNDPATIQPGDSVIHRIYGPGTFRGIEQINAAGAGTEFLRIEYADSALYVPVGRARQQLFHPPTGTQFQPASLGNFQMEYEGEACPRCGEQSTPKTKRCLKKLLICVGTSSQAYEPKKRLHCPKCDHLYEFPLIWEIRQRIGELLEDFQQLWEEVKAQNTDEEILEQIVDIIKNLQKIAILILNYSSGEGFQKVDKLLENFEQLSKKVEQQNFNKDTWRQIVDIIKKLQKVAEQQLHALHCPACNKRLPQRPTTVWVRTFDIEHPPKKAYWRELLESEEDEQEEPVEEIETEEVNDDVEEYDE